MKSSKKEAFQFLLVNKGRDFEGDKPLCSSDLKEGHAKDSNLSWHSEGTQRYSNDLGLSQSLLAKKNESKR